MADEHDNDDMQMEMEVDENAEAEEEAEQPEEVEEAEEAEGEADAGGEEEAQGDTVADGEEESIYQQPVPPQTFKFAKESNGTFHLIQKNVWQTEQKYVMVEATDPMLVEEKGNKAAGEIMYNMKMNGQLGNINPKSELAGRMVRGECDPTVHIDIEEADDKIMVWFRQQAAKPIGPNADLKEKYDYSRKWPMHEKLVHFGRTQEKWVEAIKKEMNSEDNDERDRGILLHKLLIENTTKKYVTAMDAKEFMIPLKPRVEEVYTSFVAKPKLTPKEKKRRKDENKKSGKKKKKSKKRKEREESDSETNDDSDDSDADVPPDTRPAGGPLAVRSDKAQKLVLKSDGVHRMAEMLNANNLSLLSGTQFKDMQERSEQNAVKAALAKQTLDSFVEKHRELKNKTSAGLKEAMHERDTWKAEAEKLKKRLAEQNAELRALRDSNEGSTSTAPAPNGKAAVPKAAPRKAPPGKGVAGKSK